MCTPSGVGADKMRASAREDEFHGPVDAGFGHALFRYSNHNSKNRLKAQTLQPMPAVQDGRGYMLEKYFKTTTSPAPTTYANVPIDQEEPLLAPVLRHAHHLNHQQQQQAPPHHHEAYHGHHHSRQQSHNSHHNHHVRSQSHYYHSMRSHNEPNRYCNMPPLHGYIERGARHSPPLLNDQSPLQTIHNPPAQIDSITIMQVCNEIYNNIDSSPPMPSSRKYSVVHTNGGLFKVAFPQTRTMKVDFLDKGTNSFIKAGETISVLGPSQEDRSKFTICYKDKHIDLPHQFTQAPAIGFNPYYNQGYVDSHMRCMNKAV